MNTLKFLFFIIKRFYSYFDYVKSKKQLPPGIQDLGWEEPIIFMLM